MRKIFPVILLASLASLIGFGLGFVFVSKFSKTTKPNIIQEIARPLEKYTIENLSQTQIPSAKIEIDTQSATFKMEFSPNLNPNERKTTTGSINIPDDSLKHPIVAMVRGFVDQKIYTIGTGTKRAAEVFAKNGYITIAPDFLGYADSDIESSDIFESRFQTYTAILSLLFSLDQIKEWDGKNVFLWGHSNGGQIALTVLEVTGKNYPTVLWAPVSKPFPYSVLYYTDESEDRGKLIRRELANFENLYDVEKYSIDNYLDRIRAPIELHQGTADDAVPIDWSNTLVKALENKEVDIKYYTYPKADHNLQPAWNTVVQRNLEFFGENMLK